MDIFNIESLITQGKVLDNSQIDPANDYIQVGKYVPNNRKLGGSGNSYESFALPINQIVQLPYKSYIALISQSGTAAPTLNILSNTLGNIVWIRSSTGIYRGTLTGAFPPTKSISTVSFNEANGNGGNGDYIEYASFFLDNNTIGVSTANVNISGGTFTNGDSLLSLTPIEIRVYN